MVQAAKNTWKPRGISGSVQGLQTLTPATGLAFCLSFMSVTLYVCLFEGLIWGLTRPLRSLGVEFQSCLYTVWFMTETEFASSVSDIPRRFQGHFAGSGPAVPDNHRDKEVLLLAGFSSSFKRAVLFLLATTCNNCNTVVQWLALSPQSKKVGLQVRSPGLGPVCMGSVRDLRLIPTVQKHTGKVD